MSLGEKFLYISALQKFIRRGYVEDALVVAEKLPFNILLPRLQIILFEDIGIGNIPLVLEIAPKLLALQHKIGKEKENKEDKEQEEKEEKEKEEKEKEEKEKEDKNMREAKKIIKRMALSVKSRLCSYLTYLMREVYIYPRNYMVKLWHSFSNKNIITEEEFEPFTYRADLLNYQSTNIETAMQFLGALFMKGMDAMFWELMGPEAAMLQETCASLMKNNSRALPMVWIFAWLWRYAQANDVPVIDEKSFEQASVIQVDDVGRYVFPDWVYDKHTAEGKLHGKNDTHFFTEGIQVNELADLSDWPCFAEKDEDHWCEFARLYKENKMEPLKMQRSETYCRSSDYFCVTSKSQLFTVPEEGVPIMHQKYVCRLSWNEVFPPKAHAADIPTSAFSLHKLGLMQIPMINVIGSRMYVFYFWIAHPQHPDRRIRIAVKLCESKEKAQAMSRATTLMSKEIYNSPWTFPSRVLRLQNFVSLYKGKESIILEGDIYAIVTPASPYFLPITVGLDTWKSSEVANEIVLINLLKFVYGIGDRTARNTGLYLTYTGKEETPVAPALISFDHGQLGEDMGDNFMGKMGKYNMKLLKKELEWLQEKKEKIPPPYNARVDLIKTL